MKNVSDRKNRIYPYLISVCLVFFTTLIGEFVKESLEPVNIVMLYLLAVVIVAIKWGQGPAIVASILSVLLFDFFLVPPYLTLSVERIQYIFTFIGLLVVGLVISTLASKTREQVLRWQTEKLQGALLSSISHDLRTPLSRIRLGLEMLGDKLVTVADYRAHLPGLFVGNRMVVSNVRGNGVVLLDGGKSGALVTRYGQGHPGPFNGVPGALIYIPASMLL